MKNAILLLALVFLVSAAFGQVDDKIKYYVPLVQNETDTIPGTQTGGIGAGGAGWLYVGNDDVYYTFFGTDSIGDTYLKIDYADTGYVSATGSSAKVIPHQTATRTATEDSLATPANTANPMQATGNEIRGPHTNKIEGGTWIRFRIIANNTSTFAGLAAGRIGRLVVHRVHRAP